MNCVEIDFSQWSFAARDPFQKGNQTGNQSSLKTQLISKKRSYKVDSNPLGFSRCSLISQVSRFGRLPSQ